MSRVSNYLAAHVTLLHPAPAQHYPDLDAQLQSRADQAREFEVFVGETKKMGAIGVILTVGGRWWMEKKENIRSIVLLHIRMYEEVQLDSRINGNHPSQLKHSTTIQPLDNHLVDSTLLFFTLVALPQPLTLPLIRLGVFASDRSHPPPLKLSRSPPLQLLKSLLPCSSCWTLFFISLDALILAPFTPSKCT